MADTSNSLHSIPVAGVFSKTASSSIGAGDTKRKSSSLIYYFAEEHADGGVIVRPLNDSFVPVGRGETIGRERFFDTYNPEPELWHSSVRPSMAKVEQAVRRGDGHRDKNEFYSAAFEYENALGIDEDNVRATFGLGIIHLERGDTPRAMDIFSSLVKLDAAFAPEHKHLFNEFGIKLRKCRLYDQALQYYKRAEEVGRDDEHLQYNMARVCHAMNNTDGTLSYLQEALKLNPDFQEGRRFYLAMGGDESLLPATPPEDPVFMQWMEMQEG